MCWPLPAALQELSRNIRRELAKLRLLLQQYAVLVGGAALFAADQVPRQPRTTLVTTGAAGESASRGGQQHTSSYTQHGSLANTVYNLWVVGAPATAITHHVQQSMV
jgi:hypothetical protein